LRAARALLGMTAEALAEETMLSLKTIRRAEQTDQTVSIHAANAARLVEALEAHGVELLSDDAGVGVRLKAGTTRRPNA
jgi:transcriptional regulator with XRE-family HTH domain